MIMVFCSINNIKINVDFIVEWVNLFTIQKLQMVDLNFCKNCNECNFIFDDKFIFIQEVKKCWLQRKYVPELN